MLDELICKLAFMRRLQETTYQERLATAIERAKKSDRGEAAKTAKAIRITPQALSQALIGSTKALSAESNERAARYLQCNAFWLATGEESPNMPAVGWWPFTDDLRRAIEPLDAEGLRRVENSIRAHLDMPTLPPPSKQEMAA